MDKTITDFINSLVIKCMANPIFKDQKENLEKYFYQVMIETLIDNLSQQQIDQVKDLDIKSPKMQQKLQLFAASIPGFIFILDEKLNSEASKISQTGQIPS